MVAPLRKPGHALSEEASMGVRSRGRASFMTKQAALVSA